MTNWYSSYVDVLGKPTAHRFGNENTKYEAVIFERSVFLLM
jgi:hypothetical protein